MGKSKGKNLAEKKQSDGKLLAKVGVPSRSSLKKKHTNEKTNEKKVRFSGKLEAAKAIPKVIVHQMVDSDDDVEGVSVNKSILKVKKNKNSPAMTIKSNGNQKVPKTKKDLALLPHGKISVINISDSDEESKTESEMDDDDSDLAALWDASDIEDDSDDETAMLLSDLLPVNVDLDSIDSDDAEKPTTVVIEEIPNEDKKIAPAPQTIKKLPSPSKTVVDTKSTNLKRPAEVKTDEHPSPPPKKKRLTSDEKEDIKPAPVATPVSNAVSSTPRVGQDKTAANIKKSLHKNKSDRKKKTIEELLAPHVGKCTPAEFKRLKRKLKTQERKKRSKLQKLNGKEFVGDLSVSHRAELLALSEKREEELSHRSLYIRPIPNKFNYAALKKALPSITGCRIPPKLTKILPSSSKDVSEHIYKFNRGYSFIEFPTPEEAKKQLKVLKERNKPISTSSDDKNSLRSLVARPADEKPSRESTSKLKKNLPKQSKLIDFKALHVGGLPCQVQLSQVVEFLRSKKVIMPVVAEGNLGFCLVRYDKVEDAVKVFQEKHGRSFHGSKLCVTFSHRSMSKKPV